MRWCNIESLLLKELSIQRELSSLFQWFLRGKPKGTFLKTLYLEQAPEWREEWNTRLSKGPNDMDPEDWESLPGLDDSLIPHASFLLPLSHFSVSRSRRKKLSFYGVSVPTYPSLERSLEHLQ